jgi:hypothetical protein
MTHDGDGLIVVRPGGEEKTGAGHAEQQHHDQHQASPHGRRLPGGRYGAGGGRRAGSVSRADPPEGVLAPVSTRSGSSMSGEGDR